MPAEWFNSSPVFERPKLFEWAPHVWNAKVARRYSNSDILAAMSSEPDSFVAGLLAIYTSQSSKYGWHISLQDIGERYFAPPYTGAAISQMFAKSFRRIGK